MQQFTTFVLLSSLAFAQSSTPTAQQIETLGMSNGRLWLAMPSPEMRTMYLVGIKDILLATQSKDAKDYMASGFLVKEMAASIDHFYAFPENVRIPIVNALQISVLKFKGVQPEQIESVTATFRKMLSDLPEK